MLPCPTKPDAVNGRQPQTKSSRYFELPFAGPNSPPNVSNHVLGQSGVTIAFATADASEVLDGLETSPPLCDHVADILLGRPNKEMFGVDARGIVAGVANDLCGWNPLVTEEQQRNVCGAFLFVALHGHYAVAAMIPGPKPFPTSVPNTDEVRETCLERHGSSRAIGVGLHGGNYNVGVCHAAT